MVSGVYVCAAIVCLVNGVLEEVCDNIGMCVHVRPHTTVMCVCVCVCSQWTVCVYGCVSGVYVCVWVVFIMVCWVECVCGM